uniref:Uncharacterized protein n=1 Tax=viral metagenome TaxID=1070528 RepID=A0A6C0M104_9ZZZZ
MEGILHQQIDELISYLLAIVGENPKAYSDITGVQFFMQQYSPDRLMSAIVSRVCPYKDRVIARDDRFFMEHKEVFDGLPDESVRCFTDLWRGGLLNDDEYKETIFKFFDNFVVCAEQYMKNKKRV